MPRLIFINRFFFPDHSATSQILSDLAFYLAGTGREVHVVITSTQIYDDPKGFLAGAEIVSLTCMCIPCFFDPIRTFRLARPLDRLPFVLPIGVALPHSDYSAR